MVAVPGEARSGFSAAITLHTRNTPAPHTPRPHPRRVIHAHNKYILLAIYPQPASPYIGAKSHYMGLIISFANQKGGVGKSTAAVLFCNSISNPPYNHRAVIVDTDPQQSIIQRRLADQKHTDTIPAYDVFFIPLKQLPGKIAELEAANDYVIIDLPGRMDDPSEGIAIAAVITYIDIIFVPVVPGNFSLPASVAFVIQAARMAAQQTARRSKLRLWMFGNMTDLKTTTDERHLYRMLEEFTDTGAAQLLPALLGKYASFRNTDTLHTIYNDRTPAAQNLRAWVVSIMAVLESITPK